MLVVVQTVNQLAAAAGPMALAILCQSAILAVAVAFLAAALRRTALAANYWLWQILAIKLLLMPFWASTLNVGWPVSPHSSSPRAANLKTLPNRN